ncbi:MAG: DUF6272 family protein [Brumimicrobium sp.]
MNAELKIHSDWDTVFQKIRNKNANKDTTFLLTHFGEINYDFIIGLSESIEDKLVSIDSTKGLVRRIFSVLIEGIGLASIIPKGVSNGENVNLGHIILKEEERNLFLSIGNTIEKSLLYSSLRQIEEINSLSPMELRELYHHNLCRNLVNQKEEVGMCYIVMAMKSSSKLNYHIYDTPSSLKNAYLELNMSLSDNHNII